MATYIKTLKDVDENLILPRTRADAITLSDNVTNLETALNGWRNWSNNAEMATEELATQWQINVSARANSGTQTVGFSQWYTQG